MLPMLRAQAGVNRGAVGPCETNIVQFFVFLRAADTAPAKNAARSKAEPSVFLGRRVL